MILDPKDLSALLRRMGPPLVPLDTVLQATEVTFLSAGRNLESAVDGLRALSEIFPRLEQHLGPERGAEFRDLTGEITQDVRRMAQELASFIEESAGLRLALVQIDLDVADLDRVVRTIANVSINARIQGNSLSPRRQQVTAFVEQLGQMAEDAEAILAEVKDTMAMVMSDSAKINVLVQDLQQVMTARVLPVLRRIASMGEAVGGDRAEMAQVSAQLQRSMAATFAEVSRLIMALQVGDSTRQRLERVRAIAATADQACPEGDALVTELAIALAQDAVTVVRHEVQTGIAALQDVQVSSAGAIRTAREFYLDKATRAGVGGAGLGGGLAGEETLRLKDQLSLIDGCLAGLRAEAGAVGDKLQIILGHERTLRNIANAVRLSGLNAVLICAKLGREGNALRELARWLRTLTDQSDDIVTTLQSNLDQARSLIARVGQERVDAIGNGAAGIVGKGEALTLLVADIRKDMADLTVGLARAGASLPQLLDGSAALLLQYLGATARVDEFVARLRLGAPGRAAVTPVLVEGSPLAQRLAGLRAAYTMQRERDIHDTVIGQGAHGQALGLPAPVASQPAEPADEPEAVDLDDILF
mgnify:CR=1 FL=1